MKRPRDHELEIERRSIAMLSPRAWALRREEALLVMSALAERDRQLNELRRQLAEILARLAEYE
jgi:hypothetical protein